MKTFKEILKEGFEDDITRKYTLNYNSNFRVQLRNFNTEFEGKADLFDIFRNLKDHETAKRKYKNQYSGDEYKRKKRENIEEQSPGFDKAAEELEAMIMGFEAMFLAWAAEKDREYGEFLDKLKEEDENV